MPIFEFRCNGCNNSFEEYFHTASHEDEKLVCPKCGSENVKKLLSVFSASGFEGSHEPAPSSCSTGTCSSGMCGLN